MLIYPMLLISSAAGCAPRRSVSLDIWASDQIQLATLSAPAIAPNNIFDAVDGLVTLAAAVNETLDFRLALRSPQGAVRGLKVACEPLRGGDGEIEPSAVQFYRIDSVRVPRWSGWHIRAIDPHDRVANVPDVLVPIGAQTPLDVPQGDALVLWVDLNIPKGTPPGEYSGAISITGESGLSRRIGVRLTVWPLVLPDTTPVVLLVDVDHGAVFRYHVPAAAPPTAVRGADAAPLQNWGYHPAAADFDAALASTMQLLEAHRVTPLLSRLRPVLKVGREAEVNVDWEDYDRVVADYLNGRRFYDRIPLPIWPAPFDAMFPPPPPYGAAQSPTHSRVVRQYLKACAEHFAARGWLERCVVMLPGALDGGPSARETTRHFGQIARLADARLVTVADLVPQNLADYGWYDYAYEDLSALIDVWSPRAQFFDPALMAAQRQSSSANKRTWMRIDRPPFSGCLHIASGPVSALAIAWQARSARAGAVQLGAANDWPADPEFTRGIVRRGAASAQTCIDHDPATLIYPGTPYGLVTPIPSVRLKQLRRGMQDLAYLSLLDAVGSAHISEVLTESLCPRVGAESYRSHYADGVTRAWIPDEALWADARRIIADELARGRSATLRDATTKGGASMFGAAAEAALSRGSPLEDIAGGVQWQHFMGATRKLAAAVEGVRVRRAGTRTQALIRIDVTVCLSNATRSATSGELAFERLPFGWEADPASVLVPLIAPGRMARVVLSAQTRALTWDPGGVQMMGLVFRTEDGRAVRVPARINYMTCASAATSPRIDGDLSDWPLSPANVADGFVLISGQTADDPLSANPAPARDGTPARRTQCVVSRDGNALYIAFNCWIDNDPRDGGQALLPTSARNFVQYEDLVPVGEELVEILIDPSNGGSRSPADLYHVVIKRSGAPSWERGIALDPPVGRREVWAADIRTQIRNYPDRWCAEVAIPLAAFGESVPGPQLWGINFTRFDLANQEYSNWAAATGNAYDPLSLGNVALP